MNFDNVLVNAETTGEEQVDTPREAPATTPVVSPEPVEEGTQE
jgi:hypothetical protein